MSKTTIYYFSATGNSLAVARHLAKVLDIDDPVSVPGSLINEDPYIDCRDAQAVGFVFPVHRATLPEMLRGFIQAMPVDPACYYFAVSTYTLFGSNEHWDIDELLAAKGARLNYAAAVHMMGNVGITHPSEATITRRLKHMKKQVDEVAMAVAYHQENFYPRSNKALAYLVRAFTERRRRNIVFHVDRHCKGCGICAQVCPAQNIQLPEKGVDGGQQVPIRSDKCEACLACIHWCPAAAIRTPTFLHVSYHNPEISPEELNTPLLAKGSGARSPSTSVEQGYSSSSGSTAGTASSAAADDALDEELAATLRDDLLTPADVDSWLADKEPAVIATTVFPIHSSSHLPSTGAQTMSDEEIGRALADLDA
jgi:ferredoxin/flavodoxin